MQHLISAADARSVATAEFLVSTRRCRLGNYLVVLFLASKLFYIANAVGQLFLLNVVLATKYHTLGFDVTSKLARHHDWTEDSYVAFPRVTLCDFKVKLTSQLRH